MPAMPIETIPISGFEYAFYLAKGLRNTHSKFDTKPFTQCTIIASFVNHNLKTWKFSKI